MFHAIRNLYSQRVKARNSKVSHVKHIDTQVLSSGEGSYQKQHNYDSVAVNNPAIRYHLEDMDVDFREYFQRLKHSQHGKRGGCIRGDTEDFEREFASITFAILNSLRTELSGAVSYLKEHQANLGPDEHVALKRVDAKLSQIASQTQPDASTRNQKHNCNAWFLSQLAADPSRLREMRTILLSDRGSSSKVVACIEAMIYLTDQANDLLKLSHERAIEIKYCIEGPNINSKPQRGTQTGLKPHRLDFDRIRSLSRNEYKSTPNLYGASSRQLGNSFQSSGLSPSLDKIDDESSFLQEFSPQRSVRRTSSMDHYPESLIDMYGNAGDELESSHQRLSPRVDQDALHASPSYRKYSPWSCRGNLSGQFHSRFSETTVSSPLERDTELNPSSPFGPPSPMSYFSRPPQSPERQQVPFTPSGPRTPNEGNLPSIPTISPFAFPSSRERDPWSQSPSAFNSTSLYSPDYRWSPGQEMEGTSLRMTRANEQPRMVDVRAKTERGRPMAH